MPCKDVTESMMLRLDAEDRLTAYEFTKLTCGKGVGVAGLLTERLARLESEEILAIDPLTFADDEEGIEEFLSLKHLIAVQSTIEVYLGKAPCGPAEMCAASEISFDGEETVIRARILVDLVTEAIKSCGRCKGCGTAARR